MRLQLIAARTTATAAAAAAAAASASVSALAATCDSLLKQLRLLLVLLNQHSRC